MQKPYVTPEDMEAYGGMGQAQYHIASYGGGEGMGVVGSSGEQKAGTTNYVGLTFGLESHFGELLLLVLKCREKVIPNTFLVL